MGPRSIDLEHSLDGPWVVRQWDGMDGCWADATGPLTPPAALAVWNERTDSGTKRVSFKNDIDYYRIFPADTRMFLDGREGRELFR